MTDAPDRRVVLATTLAVIFTALAISLSATPVAAQDAEPTLDCVGSGGGAAYVTDSGLSVYENDTEATIDTFYFPDSETVRFEYQSDALNLSAAGDSEARLEKGTGETTCLADVDTSEHAITIAPDDENDLTLLGTYEGISFHDVNFSTAADGADIAYDASEPTALTVHETGLPEGTVATAANDAGDELDTATAAADGSVTFDSLPSGQQDVDLTAETVADVTAEIDGDSAPTVVANTEQAVDVAVTDPDGDGIEDQTVTVDSIDDGGDGVTVDGLAESESLQTDANGEGTFSAVSFDGEPADTVDVTVSAEDGTSQTLTVTLEAGEPAAIAAEMSADNAVANGSDEVEFTVTVTDANDNPVEGESVAVDDAEDVDDLGGIDSGDSATTDASGEATFNATSTESGEFTLQFSESDSGSDTATATFEAGEPASVTLDATPDDETAVADGDDAITYTVTVTDANDNPVEGVTVEADGSAGSDISFNDDGQTTTATTDGTGAVVFVTTATDTQTDSTISFTEQINDNQETGTATFETGDPAVVSYTADPDNETATADGTDSISYTVAVTDAGNNPVEDVTVEADASAGTDVELNADGQITTESTDEAGEVVFEATATDAQADTPVTFTELENENDADGSVTFEAGDPADVALVAIEETAVANDDDELVYEVTVVDANDNGVEGADVDATHGGENITFTGDGEQVTTGADGTATVSLTSPTPQTLAVNVTETDSGLESTASGTFEPGDVDSIDLSPDSNQNLTAGDSLQFTATAYDEYDNVVEDSESGFDWRNATVGTFSETDAGEYEVIAELGGVQATTTVTVEVGAVDSVELSPEDDQTIEEGASIAFSATAIDEFGNPVETNDTAFDWENTDDEGTFQTASSGTYDVTATFDGTTSPVTTVAVESESEPDPDPDPEPEPATFELSALSLDPADTTPGEMVTVTATVTNDGETDEIQTVELAVDGTVEEQTSLALDGGETETVTFEFVALQETGGYEVGATTDDDSETAVLTVEPESDPDPEPEPAEFSIENVEIAEESITAGEEITVTVTIQNAGEEETQQILAALDGTTAREDLTVDGERSVTFTLSVPDDPGEYEITTSTDDDQRSVTVIVEAAETQPGDDDGTEDGGGADNTTDGEEQETETETETIADDDGPGFDVATVLVALLVSLVLARLRAN